MIHRILSFLRPIHRPNWRCPEEAMFRDVELWPSRGRPPPPMTRVRCHLPIGHEDPHNGNFAGRIVEWSGTDA